MKDGTARNIAITAVVAFLIVMIVLLVDAWGSTVQYPIAFGGDYDSVRIYWWEKIGADWDSAGSMKISSFPLTDSIALGDTADYKIIYWYYEGADELPAGEFIRFTGGEATVSGAAMAAIADSVDSAIIVSHGLGAYTTGGTGAGAYSVTIVTVDTAASDTVPVPHVSVVVRNAAQNTVLAGGNTDVNGELEANLDAAAHVFIASETGYTWPTYDTHTVAGTQTDTIWGYRYIPTAPSDTYLCRLWGYIRDIENKKPYKADIIVTPKGDTSNTCDNVILGSMPSSTQSDTAGYFQIDILWSSCRGDGRYNILIKEARTGAVIKTKPNYLVPDSSTHKLIF